MTNDQDRPHHSVHIALQCLSHVEFFLVDGHEHVTLKNISYLIGIVGLNECVYNLIGEQLHESDEAYMLGLEIVSFMYQKTKELSKKYSIAIKL